MIVRNSMGAVSHADDQHTPSNGFRPDIEGLRAVAVLAVVAFHAGIPGAGGGFVGVDVFFVISGFLITGLLWREAHGTGTVRLRTFYAARARRLLPASALVGIITMIASALLLNGAQAKAAMVDGIASALYVSNICFLLKGVNYFGASRHAPLSPFEHYWSLGVEEQFYLVWPALILGTAALIRLTRRRTRRQALASTRPYLIVLTVVVVVSLALSVVISYVLPTVAFFSLPTRAWQLGAGALIALTAAHWQQVSARTATILGWAGLGLILLACVRLHPSTVYPGLAALLPTLGAVAVIAAGCAIPAGGCGRLLATAPMRAIGRISYSWYLWHWPILILAAPLLGHPLDLSDRLIATAVSLALAVITFRLVENPLRYAPAIRRTALAGLGLGAVATAAAVVTGLVVLNSIPTPAGTGAPAAPLTLAATPGLPPAAALSDLTAQVQNALTAAAAREDVPSNLTPALANASLKEKDYTFDGCVLGFFADGDSHCVMGDVDSPTTVALIGDSHAAMWIPAFREIAAQRHWRLEIVAKAGCPPLEIPIANPLQRLTQWMQRCGQWRDQAVARLRAERPALIAVSVWRGYGSDNWLSGVTPYDPGWNEGLRGLVEQLHGPDTAVLVLGPIPAPGSAIPACLAGHLRDALACAPARSTAVNPSGIAAEAAATAAGGGHYADLTTLFCTNDRCPAIVGNTLVYVDWNHVTLDYAGVLAPVIGALADGAVAGS